MWFRSVGLFIFCISVTLYSCGTTDADLFVNKTVASNVWAATTLDFSKADTANNQTTNNLFSISGMIPGGFQVKSIRINNDGQMRFKYIISVESLVGDDNLLDKLKVKLMENWLIKYDGPLSGVNVTVGELEGKNDDWILVLSLDSDAEDLSQKEALFNIVIRTAINENNKGFYVEQKLENRVTTGNWKSN